MIKTILSHLRIGLPPENASSAEEAFGVTPGGLEPSTNWLHLGTMNRKHRVYGSSLSDLSRPVTGLYWSKSLRFRSWV